MRYFTDWALPQPMACCCLETFEPIEVWTTLDVGMQRGDGLDQGEHARWGAGRAGQHGPRRRLCSRWWAAPITSRPITTAPPTRCVQPGSSWKLFVYLAALEAGYTPDDRVVDTAVRIDGWSPRHRAGAMSAKSTCAPPSPIRSTRSRRSSAMRSASPRSPGDGAALGITTEINTYPAMVLGSNEVRLIDMTRAFAAVSARGADQVEPYGIPQGRDRRWRIALPA